MASLLVARSAALCRGGSCGDGTCRCDSGYFQALGTSERCVGVVSCASTSNVERWHREYPRAIVRTRRVRHGVGTRRNDCLACAALGDGRAAPLAYGGDDCGVATILLLTYLPCLPFPARHPIGCGRRCFHGTSVSGDVPLYNEEKKRVTKIFLA